MKREEGESSVESEEEQSNEYGYGRVELKRRKRKRTGKKDHETTPWFWLLTAGFLLTSPASHELSSQPGLPKSSPSLFRLFDFDFEFEQMFGNSNGSSIRPNDEASPFKAMRPMGVRWRDDARMYQYLNGELANNNHVSMPILVEQRSRSLNRLPTTSSNSPVSSSSPQSAADGLSLEDMDLIDVLWRSDIAAEKGARQLAPAEQYERDLQLLTEKSIHVPLTDEESTRYEDLSKTFYQDFFVPETFKEKTMREKAVDEESELSKRNTSTPTDEDLENLLDDMVKEGSQLDMISESMRESNSLQPLINNVSLSQALVYTTNNLTEMQYMEEERRTILQSNEQSTQPQQPYSLYNDTSLNHTWAGADVYSSPNSTDYTPFAPLAPLHTDTCEPQQQQQQHNYQTANSNEYEYSVQTSLYDSPYYPNGDGSRHMSFSGSNTDTASVCSNTSDRSPGFSDMENRSPVAISRFYGKLVPDDRETRQSTAPPSRHSTSSSFSSASPTFPLQQQQQPRRRGRQSKDEQLASDNRLPVSAEQIASMSLADLQKILKNEALTETQKVLIRKIRRRGKNKVAARTCRQRRGDRSDGKKTNDNMQVKWEPATPLYKYESDE